MEMPELNEDILEGESTSEMITQAEDSGSLDESALQAEDQMPMDIDQEQNKSNKEISSNEDIKPKQPEQEQMENNETLEDSDLQKEMEGPKENHTQKEIISENKDEKHDEEEPALKKLKLEEGKTLGSELETDEQEHLKLEPEQEAEPELETPSQPQAEMEPESQPDEEQNRNEPPQEVASVKKEIDEKPDLTNSKETEKSGPDTDMLATLASAALEQDPKEKNAPATTPKSPAKTEPDVPKKKPEMWCNVGVFDTNTTIVSDYVATPEPNEHVDLVTATLGGRRIQLEPGTAYKFRVCAVNGCGTGPWSDIAAFKTTLPGFPGAPSAIKISKSPEGAHLTWEPPGGNSSEILEYAVYLAVRSASQGCQPVTTNQAQLAFVRVFCGPTNKCVVGTNSLQAAHIDTTTKPAIIFRIAARNSKGYGPATQVRWLQESQNGTPQGAKRAVKT